MSEHPSGTSSCLSLFAPEIWLCDGDRVKMLTIPFATRMTIIRLGDGSIWVNSPVAATEERVQSVAALGEVRHIVAPNKLHHLFVGEWMARFPDAQVWAGPDLAPRRKDIDFHHELGDVAEACWESDLDQLIFHGSKVLTDSLFLHRSSKTLTVTDVIQNHEHEADGWFWRTVKQVYNISAPNGGCPWDWRMTVRDKKAARNTVKRLQTWDFDRLVVSHGRCMPSGAYAHIMNAFSWLGESS